MGWEEERIVIVDDRANRWNNELGIIVTAHHGQRVFMKACLESLQGLGWILVVYDNPQDRYEINMLDSYHYQLIDQFCMKHPTKEVPGPTYPQFWNYRNGIDLMIGRNCKYIFTIGADSVLERPEGIWEVAELLGDGDIISCSTKNPTRHKEAFCGTKSFLVKTQAFKAIVDYLQELYVPWKNVGNMEVRFGRAIRDLKINEVIVPELPLEDQFAHSYDKEGNCINRGTWGALLGYRHLVGENKIRKVNKIKPVEEKYFDKKYIQPKELQHLEKYWETKDWAHVENWWKT